jgi:prophage antirepressor-like protein
MKINELNKFFNNLPIRILGTQDFPCFYLEDIAIILSIKNPRSTIEKFGHLELVSQEQRQKFNIITYRKYKDEFRRDNTMILLTEFGLYRILFTTRSQVAERFREFVYEVLYELRTKGEYKIAGELEQLKLTNEKLEQENKELKKKQDEFKNLCDKLYLVEIENNLLENEPTSLPSSVLKKGKRKPIKYNEIDHPYVYVANNEAILGTSMDIFETSTIDTPLEELSEIHKRNNERALEIMKKNKPQYTYIITDSLSQHSNGTAVHSVWVKNGKKAMKKLDENLQDYRPRKAALTKKVYSCDKQKIIDVMNAVSD